MVVYVKSAPYETYGDYKPVELTKQRRACRDESSVNKNMYRNEVNRYNMQMTVKKEYAEQILNNRRKRQIQ